LQSSGRVCSGVALVDYERQECPGVTLVDQECPGMTLVDCE
jgi:hypothetical protein